MEYFYLIKIGYRNKKDVETTLSTDTFDTCHRAYIHGSNVYLNKIAYEPYNNVLWAILYLKNVKTGAVVDKLYLRSSNEKRPSVAP